MAKHRTKAAATSEALDPLINPEIYTQVAFVLTLALMIARAMMSESVRESVDAVFKGNSPPRGPGVASTLFLNALCFVPAMLVVLRRVVDRQYVIRFTWSHGLVAALAIWATISVAWSTDKFLTVVAAANTLASASLIWSSAQLVRSWLRLRIVAGICLGMMLFYSEQGLEYRFLSVSDNVKYFNEHKDEILREHGWEADSFAAKQFERKLGAGEMIGFNSSPNSFAAVIVLLLVISAGVAISRATAGDSIAWTVGIAILALPSLVVIYFTQARTAFGTTLLAAIALTSLASSRIRTLFATRPAQVYAAAAGLFALGVAALIGHGVYHGSLPQDSLNFRWRYWVAAARLVKQYSITGVGWGNFAEPYLGVRLPIAAEEVRDPHNLFVRGFAELGVIGGILVIAWLARSAWEITRPVSPPASTGKRSALFGAIIAVALGILLNVGFSIDFNQPGAYLTLEIFRRLLAAGLLVIGLLGATVRAGHSETVDARPAPWLLYGLLAALGAFFVHSMMEFVLAEPGPLTIFSVLLGSAIGLRTTWGVAPAPAARKPLIGLLAGGVLLWLIVIATLIIPIAEAESRAKDADDYIRAERPDLAAPLLSAAMRAVPWNWEYAYRTARAMAMAGDKPERVKAILDQAIGADRRSVIAHLTRASVELHQPKPEANQVRVDYDSALAIDPQNIQIRLDYADALQKLGDPKAATEQLKLALITNSQYHPDEPKRLSQQLVKQIEDQITPANR